MLAYLPILPYGSSLPNNGEKTMKQFPVDDDLVQTIWDRANPAPFENLTFSQALRRVLSGLETVDSSSNSIDSSAAPRIASEGRTAKVVGELVVDKGRSLEMEGLSRAQKTSIRELVRRGALREGQNVVFRDFRGTTYPEDKATVSGDALMYSDGRRYSMSSLAGMMLRKHGYKGDSVRGPIHWVTSENQTLWDLWEAAVTRNR